ncbi:MAG: phosphoglycerate kinase [Patescibacteria group bacterium]
MRIKKIDKSISNKRVLLRLDLNVPIKNSVIREDFKIKQSLKTIEFLLRNNCQIIIVSHLGRPNEGVFNKKESLNPIAKHLSNLLSRRVEFLGFDKYSKFKDIRDKISILSKKGSRVFVLDNIRFFKGEDRDCLKLGKSLASLADAYVNDAFAVSHRANSSVSAVRKYIDSYSGLLLQKEIDNLNKVLKPKKPLVLIMGGAKVSSKAPIIKNLYNKASYILLGGALINNFYLAKGFNIGDSIFDSESKDLIKGLISSKKIILPIDVVVLSKNSKGKEVKLVRKPSEVQDGESICDIGPDTINLFSSYIKKGKTIIWNGPMGMFEDDRFKNGTISVASEVAICSKGVVFGLVGGGETVEALNLSGFSSYVDWVSTGGGAMLDYLSGKKMPGLE